MSCWIVKWSFLIMWISQSGMDVLHKAAMLRSHECLEVIYRPNCDNATHLKVNESYESMNRIFGGDIHVGREKEKVMGRGRETRG